MSGLIGYGLAMVLMGSTGFFAGRGLRPRRDELAQTVAVLHNRMCQVEGSLGQVEGDLKDLEDAHEGSTAELLERIKLLDGSMAAHEERLKTLITREEVQAAFAEVARATAAQQAAQAQQAQVQRQLQRQQEVFGARPAPAPAAGIPAPARPQASYGTEQALNAQLEALNRRLAEIQSGQAA